MSVSTCPADLSFRHKYDLITVQQSLRDENTIKPVQCPFFGVQGMNFLDLF